MCLFDVRALSLHGIMPVQTTDEGIIKSPQDERKYRLENDLGMGMGMGRDVCPVTFEPCGGPCMIIRVYCLIS